jgi:hypothetical protein
MSMVRWDLSDLRLSGDRPDTEGEDAQEVSGGEARFVEAVAKAGRPPAGPLPRTRTISLLLAPLLTDSRQSVGREEWFGSIIECSHREAH